MTAALTAVSIAAVVLLLAVIWLVWEHFEQAATVRALDAALDAAEVERDLAFVDLWAAKRERDDWQVNARMHKSLYEEQVEHARLIAKGADDLALELADLAMFGRILPDLRDSADLPVTGSGDAPIYAAVRAGAA